MKVYFALEAFVTTDSNSVLTNKFENETKLIYKKLIA